MKKLVLNKETVANLNNSMMNQIKGGVVWPIVTTTRTCTKNTNCGQYTCAGDTCDPGATCPQTCQTTCC